MQTNNPLREFFRQPTIYLRLPSQGKFWPPGSIEMPPNGELPVFPMTARDEITYRTPDALFNGSAIVSVIHSCVPHIKNPWEMPTCDIDTILVAVRIASYGHSLDIETKCPKCENEANYALDLRTLLDRFQMPNFAQPLIMGDLCINFKPTSYHSMNQAGLINFENQKKLIAIEQIENEDEKNKVVSETMQKITEGLFRTIADSIQSIKTPAAIVTQTEFIVEFLNNCDRKIFEEIKRVAGELRSQNIIKPLSIKCSKCSHEYEQPFTLDMTSFFGGAS